MPSTITTPTRKTTTVADRSPFFAPSTPKIEASTPGGSKIQVSQQVKEHKSTIMGATANLINAIVGAGIVGIPYSLKEGGMVCGVGLVIFCALLTNKSLRLLVETAKHVDVPSYETLAEACFGTYGFMFVTVNMFIMAYGAMISYLMITKDTLPLVMGVSPDDLPMRRAILFVVSLCVMVPLSSQRDMADLAKTSRFAVVFDSLMVLIVIIISPWQESISDFSTILKGSVFRPDTVFVGLGVLSFAFVCQHNAFIIAGSLENPTKQRWALVAKYALTVCGCLATICGLTGYLGYLENTQGNILNNLGNSTLANVARGLLGTTMLLVFPLESFVARHVCVVTLFRGRRAHEGEDASVLNRRDRRITLTMALYLIALIPAEIFLDLGTVLAATGAVGGSCLSYIGPGVTYLGVHGAEFVAYARNYFGESYWPIPGDKDVVEVTVQRPHDSWCRRLYKTMLWYGMCMPLWCYIATVGSAGVSVHQEEMALKSPHPIRIGKVQQTRILEIASKRLLKAGGSDTDLHGREAAPLVRADSQKLIGDRTILPPPQTYQKPSSKLFQPVKVAEPKLVPQSSALQDEAPQPPEEDPQADPPKLYDFCVAIFYMVFGIVALSAGLVSIAVASQ